MEAWWAIGADKPATPKQNRAVAYYRHSAQDRQENSIEIQQDQVRKWARDNGIEIIQEFQDAGKSGLSAEHRDGFNDMIDNWVKVRKDFQLVLVLDVSRWGRFQDIDESAKYSSICTEHGKRVVYTTIGMPKTDDLFHPIVIGFERYRSAQYSRELSGKVFKGCAKISEQGFRSGGMPPFGLHRLLLDEARAPVQVLKPGERKSIQNQRVTLKPGDQDEIDTIRRIFDEFTDRGLDESTIADRLNHEKIPSPGGCEWDGGKIRHVLTNELYIGTMVYNKTTQRLKSPSRPNPREQWIRKAGAFDGIVPEEQFSRAQAMFAERVWRRSKPFMIDRIKSVYETHGIVTPRLLEADESAPSIYAYRTQFHGLHQAFQKIFTDLLTEAAHKVRARLKAEFGQVEEFSDFLVVNGTFTVLIQPAVPVPWGFQSFWSFQPDRRPIVDITLGVPLAGTEDGEILGYVAFPRVATRRAPIRVLGSQDPKLDFFGHNGLDVIRRLAQ